MSEHEERPRVILLIETVPEFSTGNSYQIQESSQIQTRTVKINFGQECPLISDILLTIHEELCDDGIVLLNVVKNLQSLQMTDAHVVDGKVDTLLLFVGAPKTFEKKPEETVKTNIK
jgi:hypothetical protein